MWQWIIPIQLGLFWNPLAEHGGSKIKPWIYVSAPFVEERADTKHKMFGEIGASMVPIEKPKEFLGLKGSELDWRPAFFLGGGIALSDRWKASMGLELIKGGPVSYLGLSYRF